MGHRFVTMGVPMGNAQLYFVDDFATTRAGWSGSGTVSGGVLTITPTISVTELLTDPGLEAWTSATNLTSYTENLAGTSTINQETSVIHGGSNAARLDVDGSNSVTQFYQAPAGIAAGDWLYATAYMKNSTTGKLAGIAFTNTAHVAGCTVTLTTSYVQYGTTSWATTNAPTVIFKRVSAASSSIYIDDVALRKLTALFHGRVHPTPWGVFTANLTMTAYTQSGIFCHADNATAPTSYDHIYHGGDGKVYLDKVIAGTRTAVANYAAVYSADAALVVTAHKNHTIDISYNGSALVAGATATGNVGKYWGLFSTYATNSFSAVSADSRSVS